MVMLPHTKYHWPISKETIIWPWGQRSRSNKGHYGMWHTALWSCTYTPNIIDLSWKTKMLWLGQQNTIKKHYLTLRSKVKIPRRSLRYTTHRLMVMHPHTKYHWPISKDKKCYGQDKKILFKKQLFDLHVKGQGPTKVITVCDTPPYGHAPTYQISLTYLERNNYLTLRSKDTVPRRSLRYVTHRLMVIHPHTKYHWPISRQKCYGPDKKILFKKQLFDLEVKGQGPRKVIMIHDTPPYGHAPIPNIIDLSQKKQLFDSKVKGQGPIKVIMVWDTPPYGHAPTYQISLTYLERNNYLTLRSKVKVQTKVIMVRDTPLMDMHPHTKYHWPISKDKKCYGPNKKILFKKQLFDLQVKGHYGMQHTTLWTCTHIPNIIDLSRKTNKLWSGQASLRSRSGRKKSDWNNIYLPSFEGET
jgi:hypothetical protein